LKGILQKIRKKTKTICFSIPVKPEGQGQAPIIQDGGEFAWRVMEKRFYHHDMPLLNPSKSLFSLFPSVKKSNFAEDSEDNKDSQLSSG
jgi:hypothetical protein